MPQKKRNRTEYMKKWYSANKEKHNENTRINHLALKTEVINFYGGKCCCCGESEIDFLAIDHIDGDGNSHRKSIGNGTRFAAWVRRNGYPDGFQILCHNCNFSKFINKGICIHQIRRGTQVVNEDAL